MNEDILQAKCYKWYHNTFCNKFKQPRHVIFSVPNEGKSAKEQAFKIATGLMAGVSDLIIVQPKRVIFVEMKTETGRQSDKQKDFESMVSALGFEYVVFRNFDEFKNFFQ